MVRSFQNFIVFHSVASVETYRHLDFGLGLLLERPEEGTQILLLGNGFQAHISRFFA